MSKQYLENEEYKDAGILFAILFTMGSIFYFTAKNIRVKKSSSASMGVRG